MFEGFERIRIETSGAEINLVQGGSGPPLLLLHGWPGTLVQWHRIAPALAERFTVVSNLPLVLPRTAPRSPRAADRQ